MSKHTPGPWVWGNYCEEVAPGSEDCCELVAYGLPDKNGSQPIIDVLNLADDFSITEANARLIAAAPDLLDALGLALAFIGDEPHITERLVAAIAKAEGVDPANAPAPAAHTSPEVNAK